MHGILETAIRLILCKKRRESVEYVRESLKVKPKDLHWLDIDQRISFKVLLIVFKCLNNLATDALKNANVITIKTHDTMLLQTNYFPETNQAREWEEEPFVFMPLSSGTGALFGYCSSCGLSSSFVDIGRFYEFARSPLCAGTGDDPKGHAGDSQVGKTERQDSCYTSSL